MNCGGRTLDPRCSMVIRDLIQEPKIFAGGSAPELEMASVLRNFAEKIPGKEQLAVRVYAEALESITVTLSENAGLDPIDILSELGPDTKKEKHGLASRS